MRASTVALHVCASEDWSSTTFHASRRLPLPLWCQPSLASIADSETAPPDSFCDLDEPLVTCTPSASPSPSSFAAAATASGASSVADVAPALRFLNRLPLANTTFPSRPTLTVTWLPWTS